MIVHLPPGHPAWPTTFPEHFAPLRAEMEAYYRELPRLLDEGDEGRYAVVKGATVWGAWDTFRDALQYGYEKFGDGRFMTQIIDARYLAAYAPWFGPHRPKDEAEA